MEQNLKNNNKLTNTSLLIIAVILLVIAGFYFAGKAILDKKTDDVQKAEQRAQEEIDDLLERVGRHITIPPDEDPLVATIEDADSLASEQGFYLGSRNGDRLIVLPKKAQAIIYREDEDKLINVGPIIINNPVEETQEEVVEEIEELEENSDEEVE